MRRNTELERGGKLGPKLTAGQWYLLARDAEYTAS